METELEKFSKTPLYALREKGSSLLMKNLNCLKVLLSDEGLPRDWRGLAHLIGISHYNNLHSCCNPMEEVFLTWKKETLEKASFKKLVEYLEKIDRYDVADDMKEYLAEDAEYYFSLHHNQQNVIFESGISTLKPNLDANILTIDDITRSRNGLSPQYYDGFVLFADEDIDFATELIENMEKFGIKLCVRERDLIGGVAFEHEAILKLISERCNRLIVIVSPAFLKSSANTFFVNFAQAIGIEQGRRKIIPCLYEKCTLPSTLKFYFFLNYERSGKLWNFWDKLRDSIQSLPNSIEDTNSSVQLTEISSNKDSQTLQLNTVTNSICNQISTINKICSNEASSKEAQTSQKTLNNNIGSNSKIKPTESMSPSPKDDEIIILNNNNNNELCITQDKSSKKVKKRKWFKRFMKSPELPA